ncbi:hypothetical protein B0H13DRAFT_2681538 [Mycena leptocephala]|nr:hypothetical protein B0H13DRAFT_2681538 [Mycena leptocephala]
MVKFAGLIVRLNQVRACPPSPSLPPLRVYLFLPIYFEACLYISIASALEIVACSASSRCLIPHNPLAHLFPGFLVVLIPSGPDVVCFNVQGFTRFDMMRSCESLFLNTDRACASAFSRCTEEDSKEHAYTNIGPHTLLIPTQKRSSGDCRYHVTSARSIVLTPRLQPCTQQLRGRASAIAICRIFTVAGSSTRARLPTTTNNGGTTREGTAG